MKNKSSKHFEFSKIIMVIAMIVNILVIIFSCFMMWITHDLTPLCYLIPAVAAEVATGSGFYYNKAKAENEIKIARSFDEMNIYDLKDKEEDI